MFLLFYSIATIGFALTVFAMFARPHSVEMVGSGIDRWRYIVHCGSLPTLIAGYLLFAGVLLHRSNMVGFEKVVGLQLFASSILRIEHLERFGYVIYNNYNKFTRVFDILPILVFSSGIVLINPLCDIFVIVYNIIFRVRVFVL